MLLKKLNEKKHDSKSIIQLMVATLVILVLATFFILFISKKTIEAAEEGAHARLKSSTIDTAAKVNNMLAVDGAIFDGLEKILQNNDVNDYDAIQQELAFLDGIITSGVISVILPDNVRITRDDVIMHEDGFFDSFAQIGDDISLRQTALKNGRNTSVVYKTLQVYKDNERIAIISLEYSCNALSHLAVSDMYDGENQMCIIDLRNGDYISDSKDFLFDNFDDYGFKIEGMEVDEVLDKVRHDKILASNVYIGNELNMVAYAVTDYSNWAIENLISYDSVMSNLKDYRKYTFVTIAVLCVFLVGYCVICISRYRKDALLLKKAAIEEEKQKNEAEFGEVIKVLSVEYSALFHLNLRDGNKKVIYISNDSVFDEVDDVTHIKRAVRSNKSLPMLYTSYVNRCVHPDDREKLLHALGMDNIRKTLANKRKESIIYRRICEGKWLYYALELAKSEAINEEPLNVAIGFALRDAEIRDEMLQKARFDTVVEERDTDGLTGLRNRYCYEHSIENFGSNGANTIACIYIDVNGLHELNEQKGHEAGDVMLKFAAGEMEKLWGNSDCYRIGGDEFVILLADKNVDDMLVEIESLVEIMEENEYHVSIGYSIADYAVVSTDTLVKDAEKMMYEEKKRYYEKYGNRRRRS